MLLALGASSLVFGSAVHVQAADEGGLGGLFQQLFSPQSASAPQPTPAQAVQPSYGQAESGHGARQSEYRSGRRAWRQSARQQQLRDLQAQVKPKVRYTALPKAEKVSAISEKASQRSAGTTEVWKYAGNPDAALLHDSTLRKGGIVITTAGPKVFAGKAGERHAAGEFEPASRSSAVDRKTRKLLATMVAPHGALPADEARKLMAKLPPSSGQSGAPAAPQAQSADLRVVYPSGQQGLAVKVSLQGN